MTPHTFKTYAGVIRNYVVAKPGEQTERHFRTVNFEKGLGHIKLSQLTPRRIGQFRDDLRDAGMTYIMTRKVLTNLHAMLEYAKSQDMISVNPAAGVEVIRPEHGRPRKIVPPSKALLRAMLAIADQDFRVVMEFAAATGVRAGELYALQWQHIDFAAGEVSIVRRVDRYGNLGNPKTEAGVRTVPISDALLGRLRSWQARTNFSADSDLIFPNSKGRYLDHYVTMQRRFKPLFAKLAQLREASPDAYPPVIRFNWHALRHFAVSTWIEGGLPPKTVQTFAGHSSLQITMDRYGHLFPSEEHRERMNAISDWLVEP